MAAKSAPKPFAPSKPKPNAPTFTPPPSKPKKDKPKNKRKDPKELTVIDEKTGLERPMTDIEIADHNSRSLRQIQNNISSDTLIKLAADFGSKAAKDTALYRNRKGIL